MEVAKYYKSHTMKVLTAIFAILILSLGLACDSSSPEDELIGKWITQSLQITNCANPNDNANFDPMSNTSCTESSPDGCIFQTFTFTASSYTSTSNAVNNGNFVDLSSTGQYSVSGNTAEFCETGVGFCRTGDFSLNGDSMSVSDLGSQGSDCVTALTASRVQ